jgi:hypothetical protein
MRYVRDGHPQQARHLIQHVLAIDPRSEHGWLLMAYVAQSNEERRAALWQLLMLNPEHERIQQAYLKLTNPTHIQRAAQNGVFLSYAQADQVFAVQLAEDLRFMGVPIWLDTVDMPNDSDWNEAVTAALERCGLMLVVTSPLAESAYNVQNEIRQFTAVGKIVVPVQRRPSSLQSIGLFTTPVDFTADYDLGLQALMQFLGMAEVARQL